MILFSDVTREFRGLIDRRSEVFTFLGTAYAAMGLFLLNVMQGGLPPSLRPIEEHLFACYAFVLTVVSGILALRMAWLHKGLVINGVLYAHFLQGQDFTLRPLIGEASRVRFWSVSFLQSMLTSLIAAISASVFALAVGMDVRPAGVVGVAVLAIWCLFYFWQHRRGEATVEVLLGEGLGSATEAEWREHNSECLQQSSRGLLGDVGFAGLMVFSGFEALSGLGQIGSRGGLDLAPDDVIRHGPAVYGSLMVVSCLLQMFVYMRVRAAIGRFSLALNPNDRPSNPWKITDQTLGFVLIAFLFAISVHVLATVAVPWLAADMSRVLVVDVVAFAAAMGFERAVLFNQDRKQRRRTAST